MIIVDTEDEQTKESTLALKDQIDSQISAVMTAIKTTIKQHQATLEKNIKDQQMNRNRSVVLEILDTMQKFKTNIEKKFAKWREDDQYN